MLHKLILITLQYSSISRTQRSRSWCYRTRKRNGWSYGWEASRREKCSWKSSEFKRAMGSHMVLSWNKLMVNEFYASPIHWEEGGLETLEGWESRESHAMMGLWIPWLAVCLTGLNVKAFATCPLMSVRFWSYSWCPWIQIYSFVLLPVDHWHQTVGNGTQWKKSKINLWDHLTQVLKKDPGQSKCSRLQD